MEIGKDFNLISYKHHILNWLYACLKEVSTLPIIRETILQYIVLIKKLTNQLTSTGMENEIKEMILKNPDYINVINDCKSVINVLREESWKYLLKVDEGVKGKGFSVIGGYQLEPCFGEDKEGVYVGLKLYKDNSSLVGTGKEGKSLFKKIKNVDNKLVNGSGAFIWYNPAQFPKKEKVSDKQLIDFYKNDDKDMLIKEIIDEAESLFKRIEKDLNAID